VPIPGMSDEKRLEAAESQRAEMERLAARLREIIIAQPPRELLGYIYSQLTLAAIYRSESTDGEATDEANSFKSLVDEMQFVLEYVHAALASTPEQETGSLDESACAELFQSAEKLKTLSMLQAMITSVGTEDGPFGADTADIEFRAKSKWILLRGNRHEVLEGEFYAFVLEPHDAILRDTYGMSAVDIAAGFQAAANASRSGYADAIEEMHQQIESAHTFAEKHGKDLNEVMPGWAEENPGRMEAAGYAAVDMFRGGICNLSRHTSLPATLLEDLSYERGEETDFYAEGPYAGTPFRTLPARKRPLIKLGDDYYAVDRAFIRDAGYRALLHNLLQRRPDYKTEFNTRQKEMSEAAFFRIFDSQLRGATVNQEVWYRDPATRQWVENDTLVRIDDVLFLVEAKAGAAATIASPATDFPRHVQSVQDLVLKAYAQCRRFFEYLASTEEVPIFRRENDRYVECDRIRLADYRALFPIGLTVESFSPFSTMCKELSDIAPILGKHGFLSLSIDDLFVLKRLLPTMGEMAHYFEVRQAIAGMKGVHLFDEFDHLGAYIRKNRFDQDIQGQNAEKNPTFLIWDGMDGIINDYFSNPDWESVPVPRQTYPSELLDLLTALDRSRLAGWLRAESHLRNFGEDGRNDIEVILSKCRDSLRDHDDRYFMFDSDPLLFIWLHKKNTLLERQAVVRKAQAAALASNSTRLVGVIAFADPDSGYERAEYFHVDVPTIRTPGNSAIYVDAERMRTRRVPKTVATSTMGKVPTRKIGRNERCWCGSGLKYKKCHGR